MRHRNASAVLTHAVHSGLIGVLNSHLGRSVVAFDDLQRNVVFNEGSLDETAEMQRAGDGRCSMIIKTLFYSKLLLSLLSPFLANAPLVDFCINLLPPCCVWPATLTGHRRIHGYRPVKRAAAGG